MADQHDHGRHINPLDLNGPNFDCEAYFKKTLKEQDLNELIKTDHQLTQEVRSLDQEMQTLVYENYNKFITATDTIRKMNQDFVLMEEEMSRLAESMSRITDSSKQVGDNLKGRRQDVQRLAKASGTLKQLESVINLPQTLQNYVQQQKDYVGAVRAYLKARPILERLKDEPALKSIYSECSTAIAEAKDQLKDAFRSRTSTNKELATIVGLLLQLNERPEDVAYEFITTANERLNSELDSLENSVDLLSSSENDSSILNTIGGTDFSTTTTTHTNGASGDVLEFVDSECSHFLGDLSLMVECGRTLFPRLADAMMEEPVDALMTKFFTCVERRFCTEPDPIGEGDLLVRALDRFYRRVHAANQLLAVGGDRYETLAKDLTCRVAMRRVEATAEQLQALLEKSFMDMRQRIASVRHIGMSMGLSIPIGGQQQLENQSINNSSKSTTTSENVNQPLADALSKLEHSLLHGLKSALAHLLQMTAGTELNWVSANGPEFLRQYSQAVREKVFAKFFQRTAELGERFCTGSGMTSMTTSGASGGGGSLFLTTAKACQNMATSTVGYVMDLCEQQFRVALNYRSSTPSMAFSRQQREKTPTTGGGEVGNTTVNELESLLKSSGRRLLEEFVTAEGFGISQMLVKSMETRDWLGGLEPRAIRPVMKRVVEDLTAIDWRVGQLFEEGNRRDRSSESSRRTSALASMSARAAAGAASSRLLLSQATGGGIDSSMAALSKKIWTERIDYLNNVDFTRVSIMTGVIKICLKTFLESARLRTFGKFGLQHVQIDCHYLQLHLWRFVSDENIVSTLLEEILSSATRRCLEPVLMEPSVVDSICERG